MTTDTLDAFRRAIYEIAEAIAPTWERRRAEVEEVSIPVRECPLAETLAGARPDPIPAAAQPAPA